MEQFKEHQAELCTLPAIPDTPPVIAAQVRMVLLREQGRTRGDVAARCGVCAPTVDRRVARFAEHGAAKLAGRSRARTQVSEHAWVHGLKLAAAPPPRSTGLTAWTTRALADHLRQTDGIMVSHNYIAACCTRRASS